MRMITMEAQPKWTKAQPNSNICVGYLFVGQTNLFYAST